MHMGMRTHTQAHAPPHDPTNSLWVCLPWRPHLSLAALLLWLLLNAPLSLITPNSQSFVSLSKFGGKILEFAKDS